LPLFFSNIYIYVVNTVMFPLLLVPTRKLLLLAKATVTGVVRVPTTNVRVNTVLPMKILPVA
jgi:hypothetical protein